MHQLQSVAHIGQYNARITELLPIIIRVITGILPRGVGAAIARRSSLLAPEAVESQIPQITHSYRTMLRRWWAQLSHNNRRCYRRVQMLQLAHRYCPQILPTDTADCASGLLRLASSVLQGTDTTIISDHHVTA